ncbi:MAG: hypothetical protein QXI16_03520 [Sulfolobaceae archaeon]
MGMEFACGKEKLSIKNMIKTILFRIAFKKENPDYFEADGLLAFVGAQGTGKTLSAVNYVYKLLERYPESKLCTNLFLNDYPIVTFEEYMEEQEDEYYSLLELNQGCEDEIKEVFYKRYLQSNRVFLFNDNDDFKKYSNGDKGVIFLVDEIQLYLNSLESKNINMEVMTQISQQRKQRKHIIATSQVFGRMAKPLREQFSNVVICKNYFNVMQNNSLIDRDSLETDSSADTQITGKVKRRFVWCHSPEMYKRYDTYYVIERGKFVAGEKKKGDIYDDSINKLSRDS